MLSKEARHHYNFFRANRDIRINYRALMSQGVSKRKSLAILKELREANLIKIVKLAGGGTNIKLVTSDVPTVGTSGIAIRAVTASKQIYTNSDTAVTTIKATNKFLDEVEGEEKNMGYEFFGATASSDDDNLRERQRFQEYRKAEYNEAREKKAEARREMHRSKVDPANWTCKDVACEFSERVSNMWHIKPFSVLETRFVQALGTFRKQHDTNGAIELEILNLFFSTLQDSKYEDGNHMWRAFLHQAPMLLQTARENVVTVEERETAIIRDQERADRKLSLLDEDDDV
jgi:hypothetical protein